MLMTDKLPSKNQKKCVIGAADLRALPSQPPSPINGIRKYKGHQRPGLFTLSLFVQPFRSLGQFVPFP